MTEPTKMAEQVGHGKGSSATLTVACKMPHGILIAEERKVTKVEVVMGGGVRDVIEYQLTGKQFKINGYSVPTVDPAAPPMSLRGSFALTHNVPRDVWERWFESNKDNPIVKNGLIFASDGEHSARDQAKDHAKEKNGLEPLDPKNLPRLSRRFKVESGNRKEEAA
jgi:hypothetical protein